MRTFTVSATRTFLIVGSLVLAAVAGAAVASGAASRSSQPAAPIAASGPSSASSSTGGTDAALSPTAADLAFVADATATNPAGKAAAGLRAGAGLLRLLASGTDRAEIRVTTAQGEKTILYVRGTIGALSASSITVMLRDGTSQVFAIDDTTKVREKGKAERPSDLSTGERAMVFGLRNADGTYTAKVIRCVTRRSAAPGPAANPGAGG